MEREEHRPFEMLALPRVGNLGPDPALPPYLFIFLKPIIAPCLLRPSCPLFPLALFSFIPRALAPKGKRWSFVNPA